MSIDLQTAFEQDYMPEDADYLQAEEAKLPVQDEYEIFPEADTAPEAATAEDKQVGLDEL